MTRSKLGTEAVSDFSFTVPLVPISVNHYKKRARSGHWYVDPKAIAFKWAIKVYAEGKKMVAKKYQLDVSVFLGKGQRGDGDNFWKVIGDGLKDAGVIHSDAAVRVWNMKVERDASNPRTEIRVRSL